MKYKLKTKNCCFDHEGMIIRGELKRIFDGDCIICKAKTLCEDNIDIMSKRDIVDAMTFGAHSTWCYCIDKLESLTIKMTQLDYEMLKFIQKQGAKYICRDKNGTLNLFENEPYIINEGDSWYVKGKGKREYFADFTQQLFQFVTWESQKYYVIKDVLNNCEVVKDENCL